MQNYRFFIPILKHIKQYQRMITHRASESVYCTTKRRLWFESFDYDEQWASTADSKIFESAHHFESNPIGTADSNSNRISKLCRSLYITCGQES